jgi:hypothetical protein
MYCTVFVLQEHHIPVIFLVHTVKQLLTNQTENKVHQLFHRVYVTKQIVSKRSLSSAWSLSYS